MSTIQLHSPVLPTRASALTLTDPTSPPASSFSITSNERRTSHEDALASLEGRVAAMHNDFMDMSDEDDTESFDSQLEAAVNEDERVVFVSLPPTGKSKSKSSQRKRGSTIESWFPLASFIELKDDESNWNWRNFIEVAGTV